MVVMEMERGKVYTGVWRQKGEGHKILIKTKDHVEFTVVVMTEQKVIMDDFSLVDVLDSVSIDR